MAPRSRGSIRLWQTGSFIAVVVVAMLILSGSLSAGLKRTLTVQVETGELRNAAALTQRLAPDFQPGTSGMANVKTTVREYRNIYGGGVWVYDSEGDLVESAFDAAPIEPVLEAARLSGSQENASYAASDLRRDGWVVASKPLTSKDGEVLGVVVTSSAVERPVAILAAVRDRLWISFWVSLAVAGLLGFAFSELISGRIRAMSAAAAAIAAGDFEQRLPTTLVPDEIRDLALSYNSMATTLGDAFGALQDSQRQISAVVESMAEGLLALDGRGVVRVANPEALRLLGLTDREVVGAAIATAIDAPEIADLLRDGLAGHQSVRSIELGSSVVLLHCTPLLDSEGTSEGAVLLLADITEQRRIEDAQRRFVADASHEMRTPVAALKGMLELLEDGAKNVPEVRDDFIKTMQLEADRLSRLVADLLTLAKLEAGNLQLEPVSLQAEDLVSDVARVMTTLAEQAGVALVTDTAADLSVDADRDRVVQVLLSFTDNALKHSPRGTRVTLSARALGENVRFEVADQGPGISPDEAARVFERFYRADTSRSGGGGTGLGLAIAKEIVEAHGSHIEVSSTPGDGTVFAFSLARIQNPNNTKT
ncbi:MAG: ATP-binding protein [Coriobacteriia bacterium]|nr:ATP-binding protein [Coriobacteriia bacterium]